MTKEEAHKAALGRWREIPLENQMIENAAAFAKLIAPSLPFETLADREKVITAWLVRDVEERTR